MPRRGSSRSSTSATRSTSPIRSSLRSNAPPRVSRSASSWGVGSRGGTARSQRRGLSAANGSVIARLRSRKRKTSAGRRRPGPRVGAHRSARYVAPLEHAPEVRRRNLVAERRDIHLAQLGQRELRRGEREARVRVGELPSEPLPSGEDDRAVVVGGLGELVDGMPARVVREVGVEAELHEPDVRRRERPGGRVAPGSP